MSAPTLEDFDRLVSETFASLGDYSEHTRADNVDMLMHDITMGRPLADMEPAIRAYAWRYCAIKRGAIPGRRRPKRHAMRDVVIRAFATAAREHDLPDGWPSIIAKHAGISPSRVWQIVGPDR